MGRLRVERGALGVLLREGKPVCGKTHWVHDKEGQVLVPLADGLGDEPEGSPPRQRAIAWVRANHQKGLPEAFARANSLAAGFAQVRPLKGFLLPIRSVANLILSQLAGPREEATGVVGRWT